MIDRPLAGIILAGGEGVRLRAYVRALVGDERPKQFCAIVGRETLLEQTRRVFGVAFVAETFGASGGCSPAMTA
jgi:mannose-1-phosphate guanylyltransferase